MHEFKLNGIYIRKIDPQSHTLVTKQKDGTYKKRKDGLLNKALGFLTSIKAPQKYAIIFITENKQYKDGDKYSRIIISSNPEASIIVIAGELYDIVNSFKGSRNYYSATHELTLLENIYGESIWQTNLKGRLGKILLKNEGNTIVYSSVNLLGNPFSENYDFIQWKSD